MLKLAKLNNTHEQDWLTHHQALFNQQYPILMASAAAIQDPTGLFKPVMQFYQQNLKVILTGEPVLLEGLINQFAVNFKVLQDYLFKRPRKNNRNKDLEAIIKATTTLFNYPDICKNRDPANINAYYLIEKHGQRICPYCQLHAINFYVTSKNGFNLRPALDHFYPESRYPWLSVSLYNLVPACEQCNSRIKGQQNPYKKIENPFSAVPVSLEVTWNSMLSLAKITQQHLFSYTIKGSTTPDKIYCRFFRLDQRYQWYQPEVLDLVKVMAKYKQLHPTTLQSLVSPEEYFLGYSQQQSHSRALGFFNQQLITAMIEHDRHYR